jgi:gamma-glutamylcyclotransferase (GGCT)/AIG2-like uncharacterized protein YtfP
MINYFAYGSNMSVPRIIQRGLSPLSGSVGILKDWKLKFNKKASKGDWAFANIEKIEGEIVEGIVFGIPESDLDKLDKFEGAPNHYRREKIEVLVKGNPIECITYIAQDEHIREGLLPTKEYIGFLIEGSALLSTEYQRMILEIPKMG